MTCADHSPSEWPGDESRCNSLLGQDARSGYAHRHNGGLRVLGETKILFRSFKAEARKRKAESRVGFGEGLGCNGKSLGEFAAHADGLRTLPGKRKAILFDIPVKFYRAALQMRPAQRQKATADPSTPLGANAPSSAQDDNVER